MSVTNIGVFAEDLTEIFLLQHGYEILERNFVKHKVGEIDFICKDPNGTIIIVEVKSRKTTVNSANPGQYITKTKLIKIYNAFFYYVEYINNQLQNENIRFDVIEVYFQPDYLNWRIEHHKNVDIN